MKAGNVPTAEVGPVIAQLIEERWPARRRPEGEEWGLSILAEKVGCHPDALDAIVRQESEGVGFDFVDKILCAFGRPDLWVGALSDIYPQRFLETCALPSCGRRFPERGSGPNRKRYCSKACSGLAWMVKKGERTGDRNVRRGRFRRCGHKMTPDNTKHIRHRDGRVGRTCRECCRKRQNEWLRRKRSKAH